MRILLSLLAVVASAVLSVGCFASADPDPDPDGPSGWATEELSCDEVTDGVYPSIHETAMELLGSGSVLVFVQEATLYQSPVLGEYETACLMTFRVSDFNTGYSEFAQVWTCSSGAQTAWTTTDFDLDVCLGIARGGLAQAIDEEVRI